MESDLISRGALIEACCATRIEVSGGDSPFEVIRRQGKVFRELVDESPTIAAVPKEKYDDLREAFVDYVCSGVPNPAPYCKNKCPECVNGRGWCTYEHGKCRGFNPDGEGGEVEDG